MAAASSAHFCSSTAGSLLVKSTYNLVPSAAPSSPLQSRGLNMRLSSTTGTCCAAELLHAVRELGAAVVAVVVAVHLLAVVVGDHDHHAAGVLDALGHHLAHCALHALVVEPDSEVAR